MIITSLGAPTSPCSDLSRRQKSTKKKKKKGNNKAHKTQKNTTKKKYLDPPTKRTSHHGYYRVSDSGYKIAPGTYKSHNSNCSFLDYDIVYSGRLVPKFRRTLLPSSTGMKTACSLFYSDTGGRMFFRNVSIHLLRQPIRSQGES